MQRGPAPWNQERAAIAALGDGLRRVDPGTLEAIGTAIDRDAERLAAGRWGSRDDGEGCLLTLAAWELGLEDGEQLMHRSIAAVQLPGLFDRAWGLILRRTGDPDIARQVTQRLVRSAIAELHPAPPAGADAPATVPQPV